MIGLFIGFLVVCFILGLLFGGGEDRSASRRKGIAHPGRDSVGRDETTDEEENDDIDAVIVSLEDPIDHEDW